jgi:hypothetical protein
VINCRVNINATIKRNLVLISIVALLVEAPKNGEAIPLVAEEEEEEKEEEDVEEDCLDIYHRIGESAFLLEFAYHGCALLLSAVKRIGQLLVRAE